MILNVDPMIQGIEFISFISYLYQWANGAGETPPFRGVPAHAGANFSRVLERG